MSTSAGLPEDFSSAPLSEREQMLAVVPADDAERVAALSAAPDRRKPRAHYGVIAGTVAVLLAIWQLIPTLGLMNPILISSPLDVVRGFWSLASGGSLFGHFAYTMGQVLLGFALGVILGLVLGTLLALVEVLHKIFTPYILALRSLPIVVLAPLFIAWFGFGIQSKIATAVTICFLPTMINTMVGLRIPGHDSLALMRALQASRWQVYRKLRFPAALPLIFVGVKHSLLLSFTGVLLAEILLGGSTRGLGTLVRLYSNQIRMDLVFAVVAVLTLLSVLLVMVFDHLDRRLIFWREEGEGRR